MLAQNGWRHRHGVGLDEDVRSWFDMPTPKTRVNRRFIERALVET
jgi:hypothetical protein